VVKAWARLERSPAPLGTVGFTGYHFPSLSGLFLASPRNPEPRRGEVDFLAGAQATVDQMVARPREHAAGKAKKAFAKAR
jgi:hypothetical protein